jgi:hypothetical protein
MSRPFTRMSTLPNVAPGKIAVAGPRVSRTFEVRYREPGSTARRTFIHNEATDGKLAARLEVLGIPFGDDDTVTTRVIDTRTIR